MAYQNKDYEKAIKKAINNPKTQVKEKPLRLIIMGTFSEKGAETFWRVVLGFPYLNSKPVAWKLCYVLHKVLREGHSLCCCHSLSHEADLDRIGEAWCHSDDDFAKIIQIYTKLLAAKLKFHFQHPDFPGHLDATLTEMQLIVKNHINNYFQLLFHIFQYWDRILEFQEAVLKSLVHRNSERKVWKCALAPLVLSIHESAQLYNHSVKIVFILRHFLLTTPQFREIRKFREQFLRLKSVYFNANILQCMNIQIPVPPLPEETPNLLMGINYGLGSSQLNSIDPGDKTSPTSSRNRLSEQIMAPEKNGFVEQNLIVLSNDSFRSHQINCSLQCCVGLFTNLLIKTNMTHGMLDNKQMVQYSTAVNKAINSVEAPVKQKHVRSAIIGTFHEQGAQTFWMLALRLPYLDDRIVAWKLCHVVHKVLREGHPLCLVHIQRHRRELDETGKLWCHLKEGYGKMIRLYTNLLMTKLDFHKRNPRFPGHLGVTAAELESIGANDINNYFQLSVEMFDYLDNILELQQAVFGSLDMSRSNSMTAAGQCRLAPLIMCIQDASRLYDYCVKILFKLQSTLPTDLLVGHRDRFLNQFKQLKQFYWNANALQYFRNLISVPPLPENPPNFLREAELRSYVTQEVVVPDKPQKDEPIKSNSIDTFKAESQSVDRIDNPSQSCISSPDLPSAPLEVHIDSVSERDNMIQYLQHELGKLRNDNYRLQRENEANANKSQEQNLEMLRNDNYRLQRENEANANRLQEQIMALERRSELLQKRQI